MGAQSHWSREKVKSSQHDHISHLLRATALNKCIVVIPHLRTRIRAPTYEHTVGVLVTMSTLTSHCKVLRDHVFTEAPKELCLDPSQCLRLKRVWYATRDAGQAFEFAVRDDFKVNTFSKRAYSPVRLPTQDTTLVVLCARRRLCGSENRSRP